MIGKSPHKTSNDWKPALAALSAHLFAVVLALAATFAHGEALPEGVRRVSPSELRIERDYIGEPGLARPVPQRPVDANPPWLHVQVPLPEGKQAAREQKWNRRFHFKLARDPELKSSVIESGPKRWSFFSPYRVLETGAWYWTYGVAPAGSPDRPVWTNPVYAFTVDAQVFTPAVPPTPAVALAALQQRGPGPVAICTREDIGHMMPDATWPELAAAVRKDLDKALKDGERPVRIELSDRDYPAYMGKNPKEVYFTLKLRSLFTVEERRVDLLLRGYLLTGDERYRKLGVQRAVELEDLRLHRSYSILGRRVPLKEPAFYNTVPLLMLDAFWDDLSAGQQKTFIDLALELMDKHGAGHPHLHDQLEHAHFNQHDWQSEIKNLLVGSAVLARHRPEFEDWFAYAYELWLYRSPALSRADGGSMDGNGYLGVHDEPLTHLNWMLYRLTGYNYFAAKRWFAGFPAYMSVMNAVGNPGVPYSDGGDSSPGVPYLTEMLARMCPENPANLWRFKSQGRRSAEEFSGDLVKGYKAMALLQAWRNVPAPDLSAARPPAESAAAFRDVGVAAMHSDLSDPARNLMVNFSSAVNGSFQHLHPSQNAFCLAYGGEPLFWRTGYYNGGAEHDILSYKCSRAHNTILADGLVQGFDLKAYGWLPRFVTGQRVSYVLGDASHAYTGTWPKYTDRKTPVEVPITPEYGFGNPGVTRFRRHVALLRPHHVLIYDELEAEKPVAWTFALHALTPIKQLGNDWFVGANIHAAGSVRLFCRDAVAGSVTDRFMGVPVDDENKRGGKNPPNWHVSITTTGKLAATRFLTVIEVLPGKHLDVKPVRPEAEGSGRVTLRLDDFTVTAELDPGRLSYLDVHDRAGTCAIVTGQATRDLALGNRVRKAEFAGSTMLWETGADGADVLHEVVDQLPPVLMYGNRY